MVKNFATEFTEILRKTFWFNCQVRQERQGKKTWRLGNLAVLITCFLLLISLISCSTPQQNTQTQIVTINYSPFIELDEVYDCANELSIILNVTDQNPEIRFQIGEPNKLYFFAYKIEEEEIVIIMNNARPPVVNLEQIQKMFTGEITNLNQITPEWGEAHLDENEKGEVSVWVFAANNDVQQIFNELILDNRPVASSARVAVSPQEMLNAIKSDRSSIGISLRSWIIDNEVFEQLLVATEPVLALTETEPQGAVKSLIGCLQ